MNIANIIIIIILILIIIWLLNKVFFRTNIVYDKMLNANKQGTVNEGSGSIFTTSTNSINNSNLNDENTSNFMLSVWFYIDNWGTSMGEEKNILFMAKNSDVKNIDGLTSMNGLTKSTKCNLNTTDISYRNLNISLDKYENNLLIDIETIGGEDCKNMPSAASSGSTNSVITRHKISNIPLQKWNCLILSVDTKTFDIYLDGKLRNSFILDGTYAGSNKKNIYLGTLDNIMGFEGFITRIRYEANPINPEQAYKIYREGINASLAKSLFNQYSLKVSFLEFNKEKGSFTI